MSALQLRLRLAAGQLARVQGPAVLRVERGQVMVLGAIYDRGSSVEVPGYRSYAVKALDDSEVEVLVSPGGGVERPSEGEEVLDTWVAVADNLLRRGCRRLMMLGPVDSGKTSMAALVANRALLRGLTPGIVDADVGQADVGPPCFVSAATVRRPLLWLRELRAEYTRMAGSIRPDRCHERIVAATVELAYRLREGGAAVIVIDTDGWVDSPQALWYKEEIARFVGVDAVLVLGDEQLQEAASRLFAGLPCGVHALPSPPAARRRDREERRELRREAYRRYLEPRRRRVIDLSRASLVNSCLYSGRLLDASLFEKLLGVRVEAASEAGQTCYVASRGKPDAAATAAAQEALGRRIYLIDLDELRGLLVALVGSDGNEHPAVVEEVSLREGRMVVETAYTGPVRGVVFGCVKLGEDYSEQQWSPRCPL